MPVLAKDPVLIATVSGSPRERGRQHGEFAREQVNRGVQRYMERFRRVAGLTRQQSREEARRYIQPLLEYDPEIVEEIRGVAHGAELAFEDVLAMNCRSELLFFDAALGKECSSFGLQPTVTADGHTYVGQNWDMFPDASGRIILILIEQDSPRPSVLLVTEAGLIGRMGLNSAGIGLCANTLIAGYRRLGVPLNGLLRGVLNQSTLRDAVDAVVQANRATTANYVVGQSGQTVNVETGPNGFEYIHTDNGIVTHANHYSGPLLAGTVEDCGAAKWPDSIARECRLRETLEPLANSITVEDMQESLSDHSGFPASVCRHANPEEDEFDQFETVASIIVDCEDAECWIAYGPPDENTYYRYSIAELGAGRVEERSVM